MLLPPSQTATRLKSHLLATIIAVLCTAFGPLGPSHAQAAEAGRAKQRFDLPADSAERALKRLSVQSGREVLFPTDVAAGVRTRPAQGQMTALEALNTMLAGTNLIGEMDPKTGSLTVRRGTAPAPNVEATRAPPRPAPRVAPAETAGTDETVQLSVFEVSAEKDVGYQAGNTTSGSRLNSSLKDTAAAVMVFTPEFLSDFGLNSLEDIIGYSPNMQADMLDTSADANPQFLGGSDLSDTRIRVRGLTASTALDFFETRIPIDNYNTERFELSSGPNSILFGFGAPGGLVNIMTKRAHLHRNRTVLRTQFGDWKFSRFEADHNHVLVPNKLAIRFNGLLQEGEGWRKWEFTDHARGAVSVRAQPWRNTTVTANYENGHNRSSVARPVNAFDSVALWQSSGGVTKADAAWTAADRALGINRNTTVRSIYVTDADGSAPFVITTSNAVNFRLLESTFENNNIPANARSGLTLVPAAQIPFSISTYGPGAMRDGRFDRVVARLEQRLTPDLSVELAYNRERTEQLVHAPQIAVNVFGGDPNTVIPNPDGSATPIANPNAGQLYIENRWTGDRGESSSDVFRGAVAWQLNLGKFGTHKLAGMGEHVKLRAFRYPQVEILVDESGVPINNAATPEVAANFIFHRQYIAPGNFDTYFGGNPNDAFTVVRNGKTYHNTYIDGSVAGGDITRTMNTLLGATQSSFFDSRLILTAGVRWDRIKFDQYGSARLSPNDPEVLAGRAIANVLQFTREIEDTTRFEPVTSTLGVVFHATKVLSLFYNHANNNSQPPLNFRVLPDEKLPDPFDGETDDFGFMLNLLDGKIFLRATAYKTSQSKASGGAFSIPLNSNENDITAPTERILQTLVENGRITAAEQLAHTVGDESNLTGTSDIVNEGYELSTWFNVTKNLTGIFNFSYTKTDRSSIVPEFEGWFEREKTFWLSTPGAGALVNSTTGTSIDGDAQSILDIMEGVREFYSFGYGERPYKANVSGRYTFSEGRLKGAFTGLGVRWQGKSKLGRVITGRSATGTRLFGDTIYGPENFKMDAFIGYRRKLSIRSARPQLTVQLNVSNVTNEDEVMPLRYNATFSGYTRVLLFEPRRFRLTVGLEF